MKPRPGGFAIGFSGTNDSDKLMPLTMKKAEVDDDYLTSTNGKMLSLTLSYVTVLPPPCGITSEGPGWQHIVHRSITEGFDALIDRGGMMAGTSNLQVAR